MLDPHLISFQVWSNLSFKKIALLDDAADKDVKEFALFE